MKTDQYINKYQIIKKLGQGGAGQVWQVYDSQFKRNLALKVIIGSQTPKTLRRFQREAKLCASLEHPNIIKIYDYFFYNKQPCIVMQYVEGKNLTDYLARAQEKLEKFSKAFYNYNKCSEFSKEKISQALDGCLRIFSRDVKQASRIFDSLNIVYELPAPPSFIDSHVNDIVKKYHREFLRWNYAQQKKEKDFKSFIEKFYQKTDTTIVEQILASMCYYPQIEKIIKQRLHKEDNENLKRTLILIRQKSKLALYYKIAKLYQSIIREQKELGIRGTKKDIVSYYKEQISVDNIPKLKEIIIDKEEMPILRYLASIAVHLLEKKIDKRFKKSLIYFYAINKLRKVYPTIKEVAYREDFREQRKSYLKDNPNSFLSLLIVSQLEEKKDLQISIRSPNIQIKIISAAKLWGNYGDEVGKQELLINTRNKDPIIRAYCLHNFFAFASTDIISRNYTSLVKRGFKDSNIDVKKATLTVLPKYFSEIKQDILSSEKRKELKFFESEEFLSILKEILYTCPDSIAKPHIIIFLANLCKDFKDFQLHLGSFITNVKQPPFLRCIALLNVFHLPSSYMALFGFDTENRLLNYIKNTIVNDSVEEFRILNYCLIGGLGLSFLPYLQEEKSLNSQATIILVSGLKGNFPVPLQIQKRNHKDDLEAIKKFFISSSGHLKRAAAAGYTLYKSNYDNNNEKPLDHFYTTVKGIDLNDVDLKTGVAVGGYWLLQNEVYPTSNHLMTVFQLAKPYNEIYIELFEKQVNSNPKRYKKIIKFLSTLSNKNNYVEEIKVLNKSQ
ncbi:protein kinase [Candidatus Uabimicrobium sp. HlEnr_7]|uniref:protein kinase domain-containing protein n=1 Tax=Candidatus Uabimicrobium helgolandensis TaxID=3095367 RepID=UPI003557AE87